MPIDSREPEWLSTPEREPDHGDSGVVTEMEEEVELRRPSLFRVLMHNDHFTTREFVVEVLKAVFRKTEGEAVQIMLHVHTKGVGVAGVYTYEIAETKIHTVEQLAENHEYPLRLSMEPEDG